MVQWAGAMSINLCYNKRVPHCASGRRCMRCVASSIMFPAMVLSCMLQKHHFYILTYCRQQMPSTCLDSRCHKSEAMHFTLKIQSAGCSKGIKNLKGLRCVVPRPRVYLACHLILGGLPQELDVVHFAIRVEGVHEDAEAPARCGLLVV